MSNVSLLEAPPVLPQGHLEDENRHFERLDGEWVEKGMGAKASRLGAIIIGLLEKHADAHQAALVFNSECGYKIFPHKPKLVRYPDFSLVRKGRLPDDEPPDGHMVIVPDLVGETVSPNDLAEEIEERVMDFLQVGVPLIWVVYPKARCVRVLRKGGSCTQLTEADELQGEDVLPGFSCRVEQLFGKK